jgi:hypothetical protein
MMFVPRIGGRHDRYPAGPNVFAAAAFAILAVEGV